jgi:transposase
MKTKETSAPLAAVGRVVGLDLHPEVFSAAGLSGRDAATAQVVQSWDRLPTAELAKWAGKLQAGDVVVLEATGNTFDAVERLHACGVKTVVLETQRAGQIRTAYCTNDRTDAVKLARIYLSGLAKIVWEPDAQTRERREVLHRYLRSVCDASRARNRVKSFLSARGARLPRGTRLTQQSGREHVLGLGTWSALQKVLLEQMLAELAAAEQRRRQLSALMAQVVADDPALLRLLRLLGVRHIIAFAVGAVVGDVARFANPKKLVAYLGLTPTVERSGNDTRGPEELRRYGRSDLRALLIQAAHVALRQTTHPLHTWAWKLCLRKSHKNVAVAAVARKLTVSIWYCLRGLFTPLAAVDTTLETKIGKIATVLGQKVIHLLGYQSKTDFVKKKASILTAPA